MIQKIRAVKILTLVTVGLLACALLLFGYTPGGETAPIEDPVYEITNISVGEISAVTIENKKAKFGVMVQGDTFEVISGVQGDYSDSELRGLIYAACHLTGSKKISEVTDGAQYGVDDPQAVITLIQADGTQQVLSLLMKNPIEETYYLLSEAEQAIYLIPADVAGLFLRQETDFFGHTVLPDVTPANYTGVESVEVDFGNQGRDYRIAQNGGGFFLESPINQRLTASVVLQKLLLPLSALYSDSFVEAGADLGEYGFNAYTLRVKMVFEGQTYTALLLDKGDGKCLMADQRTRNVYELGSESLEAVGQDYINLLDGKAFSYAAGDIESIAASWDGKEFTFRLSGTEEDVVLVSALNGAEIVGEAFEADAIEEASAGSPVLSLIYTLKTGSTQAVELISTDGNEYFVKVNGIINFTVSSSYAEGAKQALEERL